MDVALIVVAFAAVLFVVQTVSGMRLQHHLKQQDSRAIVAAEKLAEALRVAKVVSEEVTTSTAALLTSKLDIIHFLVNSNLTTALQAELDATTREMMMMKQVVSLQEEAGVKPDRQIYIDLILIGERIDKLALTLQDRLRDQIVLGDHT